MVTGKLLFSYYKTMAHKFPDCDAKELQQFQNMQKIEAQTKVPKKYCGPKGSLAASLRSK